MAIVSKPALPHQSRQPLPGPADGPRRAADLGASPEPGLDSTLDAAPEYWPYDSKLAENAVYDLLRAIGEDPQRQGLADTPRRVARAWAEMMRGMREDPAAHLLTTFDVSCDELVLVKDIEFYSMCEHHLLPFFGRAHVAYLPRDGKITGLSKLARCVDGYARRPQVQERLTGQVADALEGALNPRGLAVVVEATHMCMSMRGVSQGGSTTTTSVFRGEMQRESRRHEFMSLIDRK